VLLLGKALVKFKKRREEISLQALGIDEELEGYDRSLGRDMAVKERGVR
jgi:hypothetical protein